MSDNSTITREQLLVVYVVTELGGKVSDASHFSYAKLENSTYSFGLMQFDVGSDTTNAPNLTTLNTSACTRGRHAA